MTQTLKTKLKSAVAAFTALALSLALVPASAFAALVEFNDLSVSSKISSGGGTTGTITITGDLSSSDVTITVYRVASILLDDTTNESKWVAADDNTSDPTGDTDLTKLIAAWINAYAEDSNSNTASTTDKAAAAEAIAAEVADSNNTWVTSSDVTSSATIFKGSSQTTISDLLPGIYYVKITDSTGAVAYQPIITSIEMVASGNNDNTWKIESPESIACKSASTTVEKDVLYTDADGLYEDGDRIAFVVKFSIGSSLSEFYFWDTMTGLTFDNTTGITFYSAEPTVDESNGTVSGNSISVTEGTHYDLYTSESEHDAVYYVGSDGHSMGSSATFHVDVLASGIDALYDATNDTGEIWIVYWATVDGTAAATDGISNSFNTSIASGGVTDPDNPTGDIPGGSTLDLSTGFQIYKYDDDDNTALNGAQFAIYEATVTEVIEDNTLVGYTLSVADNASSLDTIETAEDTTNDIDGYGKTSSILFQAGKIYAIAETSAPSGYNLLSGYIYVLVNYDGTSNTLAYDSDNGYWVIGTQYTEATEDKVDTTTPSLEYAGYTTIGVPNTASDALTGDGSGIGLPTTGGMGTILFTVLGVLIMAGAAYLIIRSRKQQQQG